jgi:predicted choloylglycine hydrolase
MEMDFALRSPSAEGGLLVSALEFPIVLRYCLETCSSTPEAIQKLLSVPVHMVYNVTLIDAKMDFATVYFTPGMANRVVYHPVGTNHQEEITGPDYATMTRTVERKELLDYAIVNLGESEESMIQRFLHPPLFNTAYAKAFGTLYTAIYSPITKGLTLKWPQK